MPESLWVGLIIVVCWASLPVSLIIAISTFDHSVVRPDEHGHGHH